MFKNRTSGSVPVVHCNNVIEVSEKEFGQLIKDGKVHHLEGKLDEQSMYLRPERIYLGLPTPRAWPTSAPSSPRR